MENLDAYQYSTIDVSVLKMDHETSQCAGVSLLDVSHVSFDSFLISDGTFIPQFIFDSIDVMQNGKTMSIPTPSQEPGSTAYSASSSESSDHNTTKSLYISPSKQILDLLCATDVTNQDDQSDTDLVDHEHNIPDYQQKDTSDLSDTTPSVSSSDVILDAESPMSVNTVYSDFSYESSYPPVNRNIPTAACVTQYHEYNTANEVSSNGLDARPVPSVFEPTVPVPHVPSVSSIPSVPSVSSIGNLPQDCNKNTYQEETSPSCKIGTHSTIVAAQLSSQKPFPEYIPSFFSMLDKPTQIESSFSRQDIPLGESLPSFRRSDKLLVRGESLYSNQDKHPGKFQPFPSRIDMHQKRMASSLSSKDIPLIEYKPYAHPSRQTNVLSCQSTNPGDSLPTFSITDTFGTREETPSQYVPSSKWLEKHTVGEVSQLSSYMEPIPIVRKLEHFAAPRHINIQPMSSQLLIISDIPPASAVSSQVVPALSPTESESSESDVGTKRKGRTTYSMKQQRILEKSFLENPYPDTEKIELLATDLDFTVQRLRIWFQNKRSRFRRRAKNNETSANPIYQPPLPLVVSSRTQPLPSFVQPLLHSDLSNESQTSLSDMPPMQQTTPLSTSQMTSKIQSDVKASHGHHVSFGTVPRMQYSSYLPTSTEQKAFPIIPTAVRYNSKLLTSAVLNQFNTVPRVSEGVSTNLLPIPCKVSSDNSSFCGVMSQPRRLLSSLENTLPPSRSTVLTPGLHFPSSVLKTGPVSETENYPYIMNHLQKHSLEYTSSCSDGSVRFPLASAPLSFGFQPYFPHVVQPDFPSYGGRNVPPYYRG